MRAARTSIDQATADLVLKLQLEDAGIHLEARNDTSTDPTDEELAFQLQQEALQTISQCLDDKRMALSIAAAMQTDGPIIANGIHGRGQGRLGTADHDSTALDDFITEIRATLPTNPFVDASFCQPDGPQLVRMSPCVACQTELFQISLTNESLFPPRCCRRPIDLDLARIFITPELVEQYIKKKVEFETPNRTYCHAKQCSTFTPAAAIKSNIATCLECRFTTCTACKERAHTGDCPTDTELQQLLAAAKANGWQRCFNCWLIVELTHGCNHMTCRCGTQFCYNCGRRWGTCSCAEWNDHRLLERAYGIIDRGGGAQVTAAGPDAATVERTMEDLRRNHECTHARYWRRIDGSHRCEECSYRLPNFILECPDCQLRACVRCNNNRL
ncbi:hypothetical protein BJY01DRAFT_257966 [Aspergillus pseudoustus]|uniref:RBR-type E3 ubiquitin transferase n=1 Tax=Aspergillus pseudoustus TaxID=1810923 RepID=A0ABR4JEZ7_9EURO